MKFSSCCAALTAVLAVNAIALPKWEALDPLCTETIVSRHRVTVTEAPYVHSITTGTTTITKKDWTTTLTETNATETLTSITGTYVVTSTNFQKTNSSRTVTTTLLPSTVSQCTVGLSRTTTTTTVRVRPENTPEGWSTSSTEPVNSQSSLRIPRVKTSGPPHSIFITNVLETTTLVVEEMPTMTDYSEHAYLFTAAADAYSISYDYEKRGEPTGLPSWLASETRPVVQVVQSALKNIQDNFMKPPKLFANVERDASDEPSGAAVTEPVKTVVQTMTIGLQELATMKGFTPNENFKSIMDGMNLGHGFEKRDAVEAPFGPAVTEPVKTVVETIAINLQDLATMEGFTPNENFKSIMGNLQRDEARVSSFEKRNKAYYTTTGGATVTEGPHIPRKRPDGDVPMSMTRMTAGGRTVTVQQPASTKTVVTVTTKAPCAVLNLFNPWTYAFNPKCSQEERNEELEKIKKYVADHGHIPMDEYGYYIPAYGDGYPWVKREVVAEASRPVDATTSTTKHTPRPAVITKYVAFKSLIWQIWQEDLEDGSHRYSTEQLYKPTILTKHLPTPCWFDPKCVPESTKQKRQDFQVRTLAEGGRCEHTTTQHLTMTQQVVPSATTTKILATITVPVKTVTEFVTETMTIHDQEMTSTTELKPVKTVIETPPAFSVKSDCMAHCHPGFVQRLEKFRQNCPFYQVCGERPQNLANARVLDQNKGIGTMEDCHHLCSVTKGCTVYVLDGTQGEELTCTLYDVVGVNIEGHKKRGISYGYYKGGSCGKKHPDAWNGESKEDPITITEITTSTIGVASKPSKLITKAIETTRAVEQPATDLRTDGILRLTSVHTVFKSRSS